MWVIQLSLTLISLSLSAVAGRLRSHLVYHHPAGQWGGIDAQLMGYLVSPEDIEVRPSTKLDGPPKCYIIIT